MMVPELTFVRCWEPGCDEVAWVKESYHLPGTSGPVHHMRIECYNGHHFNGPPPPGADLSDAGAPW